MSLPPYLFFLCLSAVSGFPFPADTSPIAQGVPSFAIFFYCNELLFFLFSAAGYQVVFYTPFSVFLKQMVFACHILYLFDTLRKF
jgi:hypothetical protein